METKRFIGNDLARLYDRVRREFGPDAIIVRTRSLLREGAEPLIELLAAPPQAGGELALDLQWTMVDGALGRLQIARPRATVGDLEDLVVREAEAVTPRAIAAPVGYAQAPDPQWEEPASTPGHEAPWEGAEPAPSPPPRRRPFQPLADIPDADIPAAGWAARPRPAAPTASYPGFAPSAPEPAPAQGSRGVAASLAAAGLSAAAAAAVVAASPRDWDPLHALASFLEALEPRYPDETETALITMVGAPGAGRTTALLRMALDCADTGRETVLLAADRARAAGREQVHAYGEATGLPVLDAMDANALRAAVGRARKGSCLFADVAAASAGPHMRGAESFTYLVLPAHWQAGALRGACSGLATGGIAGAVLSFTDVATDLSPALSLLIESRLPLTFISSGRDVSSGIEIADPSSLASRVLQSIGEEHADEDLVASA